VFSEVQKIDEFKCDDRGGVEVDFGRAAVVEGFFPAQNTEAPLIAGLESGEGKFRARSHEIVSLISAELEEFPSHDGADTMKPAVAGPGAAAAIAEEAGHGVGGASSEIFSEDIEVSHAGSLAPSWESGKSEPKERSYVISIASVRYNVVLT
jgi:hypothetical protein